MKRRRPTHRTSKPLRASGISLESRKSQAARLTRRLAKLYPIAECALTHRDPFELLVATILSAQCTDKKVNEVTPELFNRWPSAAALAAADQAAVEKVIHATGFFRAKAKNLRAMAQGLVDRHEGRVPRTLEELTALAGVGRKTALVVLGTAFKLASGVVVDTHVARLSKRLGLTSATDAVKVERDLLEVLPRKQWVNFSHRMIMLGRQICIAQRPRCPICELRSICPQVGVVKVDGSGVDLIK